jgi:hypothetical protein
VSPAHTPSPQKPHVDIAQSLGHVVAVSPQALWQTPSPHVPHPPQSCGHVIAVSPQMPPSQTKSPHVPHPPQSDGQVFAFSPHAASQIWLPQTHLLAQSFGQLCGFSLQPGSHTPSPQNWPALHPMQS